MNAHEMTYRVSYGDTDKMGVVYYANYLELFERGRTEMLRDAGFPYAEMERRDLFLPVVEARCFYHASAHYDDQVTIRTHVTELRGVRLTVATEVFCNETLLVDGYVVLACVNAARKVVRVPDFLKEALRAVTGAEVRP